MVEAFPGSSESLSPRQTLLRDLISIARDGAPRAAVIVAPRGWGKRDMLDRVRAQVDPSGTIPVLLDLARCVTHPEEFALCIARGVLEEASGARGAPPDPAAPERKDPAEGRPTRLAATAAARGLHRVASLLERLEPLISGGRRSAESIVDAALALPGALAVDRGRPVLLLVGAIHEISRLMPFPGLKRAPEMLARHLARSPRVRLIASASPGGRPRPLLEALAREMPDDLSVLHVPPLSEEEVRGLVARAGGAAGAAREVLRLTAGRPLTAAILARHLATGSPMDQLLSRLLAPGEGPLFHELRFDYHLLIERTRGHAASRAILHVLAREEGLDLSGISRRLRRSGGSTLDYIRWLQEVDLLRRDGRRYFFSDPLLRLYVLLHDLPERPERPAERDALIRRALAGLEAAPAPLRPLGRPRGGRGAARHATPLPDRAQHGRGARREDSLMEID